MTTLADGSFWGYGYDGLGQVTSGVRRWSDGTLVAGQQFDYAFDTIGNRTQTERGGSPTGAALRVANYQANALNQITQRDVSPWLDVMGVAFANNTVTVNGSTAYRKGEYFRGQTEAGNGSSAAWEGITVSNNQGVVNGNVYVPQTPEHFKYDADGNLTNDGRWYYVWDGENRLLSMTSMANAPAGSKLQLNFAYDYMGRRIQKAVYTWNGTSWVISQCATNFAYDGWNCVAAISASSGLAESFLWGTDLSGTMQGAGGVGGLLEVSTYGSGTTNYFVAYDGNGNVSALVNAANGTVLPNYEYGPFGEVIRATGPMAKVNPFRFSTKYDDDESDFLYYGHRYYNPSTGRWLSRDPIGEKGGLNLYGFISNDPLSNIDENGLCCICMYVHLGPPATSAGGQLVGPPPTLQIGVKVPYTIKTLGNPTECSCHYIDNGTLTGSYQPAHGPGGPITQTWNNVSHFIPLCASGVDQPGFTISVPPHGGPLTFTMTYNWTGTLVCQDSTKAIFSSASISKMTATSPPQGVNW